jgi:hypothetical protein
MPSGAVIIVFVSFLLVVLVSGPSSAFNAFAKPTGPGGTTSTDCGPGTPNGQKTKCCYSTLDSQGNIQDTYCATCKIVPPTNYISCAGATWTKARTGIVNNNVANSVGTTTGNNTGTSTPGGIIKVPLNLTKARLGPITLSPPGGGTRTGTAENTVVPGIPIRNGTNALPTGNSAGTTPPPPPTALVGCGPGTDNSTCNTSTSNQSAAAPPTEPGCGPGTDNSTCNTSTPNPQSTPTPPPTPQTTCPDGSQPDSSGKCPTSNPNSPSPPPSSNTNNPPPNNPPASGGSSSSNGAGSDSSNNNNNGGGSSSTGTSSPSK